MKSQVIYESGEHKWVFIGRDPEKLNEVIDTNEYLIISNGQGVLLDPGGTAIFPQVLTELTRHISTENIKVIISSHQDPDIASSLAMWLDLCPDVKVYCSWLWTGFLSHFGIGSTLKLIGVPDEGMEVPIGTSNSSIYLVPAHFCHSSGNFTVYDPKADILFSGDIGAALLPNQETSVFVGDFDKHIQYIEKFHLRWLPSTSALKSWVRRARYLNPSMIAPQHGTIFSGDNVSKFLDWLDSLDVGKWENDDRGKDLKNTPWMKWKR
jgi:flavorubredoxin